MVKAAVKSVVPKRVFHFLRRVEQSVFGLEHRYRHLETEDIFEEIYRKGIWGKDENGLSTSGIGSRMDSLAAPYVDAVRQVVDDYPVKTAVDLGCGDFAVGSRIHDLFEHYIACDISATILERNRDLHQAPNLDFCKLDLVQDDLPGADIAFVRQVLQHLSNQDIAAFVHRVNEGGQYRFLVVTEHLPLSPGFRPNVDKPSGPSIRADIDSGVVVHQPPFRLRYKEMHDICTVEEITGRDKAVLKSTLYIL